MEAKSFYAEFVEREEAVKDLKEEMKAMLDSFASSNNLTTKGIVKGIKEYKAFLKDQAEFRVTDADADTVFEQLAA